MLSTLDFIGSGWWLADLKYYCSSLCIEQGLLTMQHFHTKIQTIGGQHRTLSKIIIRF